MKETQTRPKELKGLKPDLKVSGMGSWYRCFDFYQKDDNVYIFLASSSRKLKSSWMIIENFKQYTALEVINAISKDAMRSSIADGILKLWKANDLPLGWFLDWR